MPKYFFPILGLVAVFLFSSCGNDDDVDDSDGTDTSGTDGYISDVQVEVQDTINTILVVTWSQDVAVDEVFLRFTFENDEWMESYPKSGEVGENREVILGIPGDTDVTFHVVLTQSGKEMESIAYQGTTGSVPAGVPNPMIDSYNPSQASPNRWLFGSVEAKVHEDDYYTGPFWLYIIDREGRIVWYYADLADNPIIGFPRISRDGRYIYYGNRCPWDQYNEFISTVDKMTLDLEYYEEIEIPLWDNVDMTDSGSLLFNTPDFNGFSDVWLREYMSDGTTRDIWNCSEVFDYCYSNTVNWNPLDDTVLLSFPYSNTVVEIDRVTGDMVGQYGEAPGSYSFDNPQLGFGFQHYANITPEGTLMVSSHIPNIEGEHAFMEFVIDRDNEVLLDEWIYREGDEWADAMGEAHRVPNGNGNVIANYGTGGVIKEITPAKTTAWYVEFVWFDEGTMFNRMVGHCTLLDDLYAINQGPQ